jgi:hypothetical protein
VRGRSLFYPGKTHGVFPNYRSEQLATVTQVREYHIRKNSGGQYLVEALAGLMDTYFLRNPANTYSTRFDGLQEAKTAAQEDAKRRGFKPFITTYR